MPIEITLDKLEDPEFEITDDCDAYTVYVDDHRILTIVTYCDSLASKWVKDVHKSHRTKHGTLLVGVCVDRKNIQYNEHGLLDSPYDLLQLCVGSHCLIFHLPLIDCDEYVPLKFLNEFFSDPRVFAVGFDMVTMARILKKYYRIEVKNAVDLRSLAEKTLERDDLDLRRYDLDRLAKVVLGKHMDVIRPEEKLAWFDRLRFPCWFERKLRPEKVKYATVDSYLCFLIGNKLFDIVYASSSSSSVIKKKNNNKKK